MLKRDATTHWEGDLMSGKGNVVLQTSGAADFDMSFGSRIGDSRATTSPEELIAAAHSACLAMNMSRVLATKKLIATSIDVSAGVSLGRAQGGGIEIRDIALVLRADVPAVSAARFRELATFAALTCPVSRALTGATVTLNAGLDRTLRY
ncbi:osmotically inducible protein OsmC [Kibdelosporangium banguiense]|uniref:Osmotically inducible protein OsmC n=1 Tax=Kibdelosporangium banguiense TaxID=1365924 RepID=A0ABS4TIA9_9PSEU|nr:OsmC family peroxiredoxin [Kibdelosporangium banguiense]MBP2323750.1 osmotically inducible protein OsmC [Kibdelosporangium banguiense]